MIVFRAAEDWVDVVSDGPEMVVRDRFWEPYADVDQGDDDENREREHDRVERDGSTEVGHL